MSNDELRLEQARRALREAIALSESAQRTSEKMLVAKVVVK